MTSTDKTIQTLKKQISDQIKVKTDLIDIILVHQGCLIQIISDHEISNENIFKICIQFEEEQKSKQSYFPFHIYKYNEKNKAYSETLMLNNVDDISKTTVTSSGTTMVTTSRSLSQTDAILKIREIDAAALFYGVDIDFEFYAKNEHEIFKFQQHYRYVQMSISGRNFAVESFLIEQQKDLKMIKFKLISGSY